ncbi:MAG: hypothetical protein A7315_02355 [Candidatus Altiarchaeales archaeon WOR_SM1_79]|nr:MAG: hypothetical protein A7315_02355 [Candidatus Altiarchaeales archaeon WOR_SM1_79]
MAKKRKKEKEEEGYEFKMPEFDEEEYLRKEVRDAKSLFVTIVYAVGIGIISFGLTFVDLALAVLVGFIAIVFLRHIYPMIGVDTTLIEKKQWAGNIIMYIFTWLAIWILLSNPPFSDFAAPTIKEDGIYFGGPGNWTKLNETNDIGRGMNVSINITVIDNVDVDVKSVRISIKRNDVEIEDSGMVFMKDNRYIFVLYNISNGEYEYTITAKDVNNHKASFSKTFFVP